MMRTAYLATAIMEHYYTERQDRQLKHLQGCWVNNGLPVIATTNLIHFEILKQL